MKLIAYILLSSSVSLLTITTLFKLDGKGWYIPMWLVVVAVAIFLVSLLNLLRMGSY